MSKIIDTDVVQEMSEAYVGFALATLNRALPSAVSGLKIVQQRILQTAFEEKFSSDAPTKKSARLTGMLSAYYHPHGSAYMACVKLADKADFQHTLLKLQGNAGGFSEAGLRISDDSPASERYTELKLTPFAEAVYFNDGSWKYCEFKPNYDGTRNEVIEFVPALPMALLNAAQGITAGYATSTASYNLLELARYAETRKSLPLPDFASTASLANDEGLQQALQGHGTLRMVGAYECNANKITITSLPLISAEKFCTQIKSNIDKFPDIRHVNDLSSREGILIEVLCKKGKQASATLPLLLQHTGLSDTLSVNNTLLVNGLPKQLSVAEIYSQWLEARKAVLAKQFVAEIAEFDAKLAMQEALLICLAEKPLFMRCILEADDAMQALQQAFPLTVEQATFVLSKTLRSITKLEQGQLQLTIADLQASKEQAQINLADLDAFIIKQIKSIAKQFGTKRQCKVISAMPSVPERVRQPRKAKPAKALSLPEELLDEAKKAGLNWSIRRVNSIARNYNAGKYKLKELYKSPAECIRAHIKAEAK